MAPVLLMEVLTEEDDTDELASDEMVRAKGIAGKEEGATGGTGSAVGLSIIIVEMDEDDGEFEATTAAGMAASGEGTKKRWLWADGGLRANGKG